MDRSKVIPPGSIIGIPGDGQLARMLALAAGALGYRVFVIGPGGRDSPAGQVSWRAEKWGDDAHVDEHLFFEFCKIVDVVLIEWENVPVRLMQRIEEFGVQVCPGSRVLEIAQDRLKEKNFARQHGMQTPEFRTIGTDADVTGKRGVAHEPCILKTCRGGYDGKNQVPLEVGDSVEAAWISLKRSPCILETKVNFAYEFSVIVAASCNEMLCYPPVVNEHRDGILWRSTYPGNVSKYITERSRDETMMLARALDVRGVLTVEYFATTDGDFVFNEMAPRTHNSGHMTINCFLTSQFQQHVLAACNLPLGPVQAHSRGVMTNILGQECHEWHDHLKSGDALHLYGKDKPEKGRKMGHVTRRWNTWDSKKS